MMTDQMDLVRDIDFAVSISNLLSTEATNLK